MAAAHPRRICTPCGKVCELNEVKTCAKCRLEYYCSSACQRAHWPQHKKTCSELGQDMARAHKAAMNLIKFLMAILDEPLGGVETSSRLSDTVREEARKAPSGRGALVFVFDSAQACADCLRTLELAQLNRSAAPHSGKIELPVIFVPLPWKGSNVPNASVLAGLDEEQGGKLSAAARTMPPDLGAAMCVVVNCRTESGALTQRSAFVTETYDKAVVAGASAGGVPPPKPSRGVAASDVLAFTLKAIATDDAWASARRRIGGAEMYADIATPEPVSRLDSGVLQRLPTVLWLTPRHTGGDAPRRVGPIMRVAELAALSPDDFAGAGDRAAAILRGKAPRPPRSARGARRARPPPPAVAVPLSDDEGMREDWAIGSDMLRDVGRDYALLAASPLVDFRADERLVVAAVPVWIRDDDDAYLIQSAVVSARGPHPLGAAKVRLGGRRVRIRALQGRPELNGLCGVAKDERFDEQMIPGTVVPSGVRNPVVLDDGTSVLVRPANLLPLGEGDEPLQASLSAMLERNRLSAAPLPPWPAADA